MGWGAWTCQQRSWKMIATLFCFCFVCEWHNSSSHLTVFGVAKTKGMILVAAIYKACTPFQGWNDLPPLATSRLTDTIWNFQVCLLSIDSLCTQEKKQFFKVCCKSSKNLKCWHELSGNCAYIRSHPSWLQSSKLMWQLLDWVTMGRTSAYQATKPGLNLVLSVT